jgi:membrane-associated protein
MTISSALGDASVIEAAAALAVATTTSLYLLVAVVVAVDVLFPLLPAEATLVSAVVLAAAGRVNVALVVAAAVGGAMAGDYVAYTVGRRLSVLPLPRLVRRRRARRAFVRALDGLMRHRVGTLVAARFVPFGRTATTTMAGYLGFPRLRFVAASSIAGLVWALCYVTLGYAASVFISGPYWQRAVVGLLTASAIGICVDVVRRIAEVRRNLSARMLPAASQVPARGVPVPRRSRAAATGR